MLMRIVFVFYHLLRFGDCVFSDLKQASPRELDTPNRLLNWISHVHHIAPAAVQIGDGA